MLRMSEVTTPANAAFTQALSANEVMEEHENDPPYWETFKRMLNYFRIEFISITNLSMFLCFSSDFPSSSIQLQHRSANFRPIPHSPG